MITDDKLSPLLAVRDVARILNIHANTVRRWSDRGLINSYRIGHRGDRRFKLEDVRRILSEFNVYTSSNQKDGSTYG